MFAPAHVDGHSLVILQRRDGWLGPAFSVEEHGYLEDDGETLSLVRGERRRELTDDERVSFMIVRADTMIAECRGFDLFLVQ